MWYSSHRVINAGSSSQRKNRNKENNKRWGHFKVGDKSWNMSLSATWSLMTAGWHFQCNCCDSVLRTKKSLGTHMMIKHLKTLRQQRSLKWGTRTNMVAMRVDILKFCLLLANKLDACPKQENILWAIKTAPEKILPLIFWSVKSLSSNWIKLHHNSVWLSPKWNQIGPTAFDKTLSLRNPHRQSKCQSLLKAARSNCQIKQLVPHNWSFVLRV